MLCMLISMKPNQEERDKLAGRIRGAYEKSSYSISDLAKAARVNAGQASRIVAGKFKTISGSVLQICTILDVDPLVAASSSQKSAGQSAQANVAWARLEASVRRAWDKTPQGAERLVKVLDAVAEVGGR